MSNTGSELAVGLMQMATDAARVPELEATIRNLQTADELNAHTITELNKQIIDHVNAHAETKLQLRAAEVARDNAELRFLEVDDHKLSLVRTLQTMVAEAQEMLRAIEPEKARPSYEGKWLCDVQGWQSITLEQWIVYGGDVGKFAVGVPAVPNPTHAPQPEGVSVQQDPTLGQVALTGTGIDVSLSGSEDQSGVDPTSVEHSNTDAPSQDNSLTLSASVLPEAQEVASSPGPFVSSSMGSMESTSQSPNAPIGSVESGMSANSPNAPQPKATEDGENDFWPTGFSRAAYLG